MLSFLSFLSPYKWLIELLSAVCLLAGISYSVHLFLEHEQEIGYKKAVAEYTAKALVAEQAARAKENLFAKQLQEAQNAATAREQEIKRLTDALSANSSSLQHSITTARSGVPSATIDALRKTADTALALLGECQSQYSGVAKEADGIASDVQTLEQAWPK